MREEVKRPPEASNQRADIDENSVEMDNADVILVDAGRKAIQVIKVVRELTSLGLVEAKDLVDGAPKPILAGIAKEEAEDAKRKLEEAGATVELTGFEQVTENQKLDNLGSSAEQVEKPVESFLRQNSQQNSAKTNNRNSNKSENGKAFLKIPVLWWHLLVIAMFAVTLVSYEPAIDSDFAAVSFVSSLLIGGAAFIVLIFYWAPYVSQPFTEKRDAAYNALPDVVTSKGKVRPPRPPWTQANKQQKCDRCDWRGAVFHGKSRRWQDNTKEGTVFGTAAWVYQTPFMCWNCKHEWTEQTGSRFGI